MKYYIVVGEASGDLLGSHLMKELKKHDTSAEFRFWGGDLMKEQGGTMVRHYKDHDFMGVVQVVMNLRTILGNVTFCKKDIAEYKPDAVIFVDFPGFNLRVAPYVKNKLGIKTFFYVLPSIWAWKESRIKHIKKGVDKLFAILPFEKEYCQNRHNYTVDYCGHPLLDQIDMADISKTEAEFTAENNLPAKPIIAVLPGSRKSEIDENMKCMQSIAGDFPDYQFVVGGMDRFSLEFYQSKITADNVSVVFEQTYQLIKLAKAAIVVSGTATLETAIIGTPEVLVYKTHPISWNLGKMVYKLKFIGLPNIIMNEIVVTELLQNDLTSENLKKELNGLLFDEKKREKLFDVYAEIRRKLGGGGASKRVAQKMWEYMNE